MCKLCDYVSDSGWTQIGWSAFSKACREKRKSNEKCRTWDRYQHHVLCFHTSHQNPTTRQECKRSRDHEGEIVVLMHADPSALLPSAKDLGDIPQMYSDHIVTKKRIRIDPAIRAERKTWPNTKRERLGQTQNLLVTDSEVSPSHLPRVTGCSLKTSCKRPRKVRAEADFIILKMADEWAI